MVNTLQLFVFSAETHVEKDVYLDRIHIKGLKSVMSLLLKDAFNCFVLLLIQPVKINNEQKSIYLTKYRCKHGPH